ncbi:MAG: DUF4065 domain-containing protein [Alphaproteobacteria bacterium]|nr:DUF4065 domain-containing protein [Alphaproteobacteria bacterium]
MGIHSTAVANRFLEHAENAERKLTQMQLQKLVYIAHGWNLAINDRALTEDHPIAWDYGPVYYDLWKALRRYGVSPVTEKVKIGDFDAGATGRRTNQISTGSFDKDETALVDKTFEVYGKYEAFKLSAITHAEGTPWDEVFIKNEGKKSVIPNKLIKEYFYELAGQRAAE